MSIRHYTPRRRRLGISPRARMTLYASLVLTIFLQMSYPLVDGSFLTFVTVATVYCAAISMSIHALLSFGRVYATRLVLTTYLFAFLIETLGIHTGWPFGVYSYDASLGVALLGVPLVVPCAWISMSHVAIIVARRMSTHWVFLYGGALLAVWDYFLDPQMVSAGRWHWKEITSNLPGTPDIPLSNFFGWLLAGSALIALLNKILPRERRKESANNTAMNIYLFWVFFSAVVGNLFFFDRPLVALVSFLSFGALIAPFFYKSTLGDSLA